MISTAGIQLMLAQAVDGTPTELPGDGEDLSALVEKLQEFGAEYGLKIIGAILIFVVGRIVAKILRNVVKRLLTRAKAEPTLVDFVSGFTYAILTVFVILASLGALGVQTTSFIAVLGAAGLAVGLALQGSLANFAGGVMLMTFRPFKVGDFIEAAGETGTVESVHIFTSQICTPDNKTVIIPNAKITSDNITNYTVKGTRRVDLVVGISYESDIPKAKQIINETLAKDGRILEDPAPTVAVVDLADSSVNLVVRPWTSADVYWDVYFGTLEAVKIALDEAGVTIPFPQRDVHLYKHDAE